MPTLHISSIALLLGGRLPLNTAGLWTFDIVAGIAALFAILQLIGKRRMNT